jgi:hypothetical protein
VTGKRRGVARVVDQLMDEILIQRSLTLNDAQEQSLIDPEDIDRERAKQTREKLRANARDNQRNCSCHRDLSNRFLSRDNRFDHMIG